MERIGEIPLERLAQLHKAVSHLYDVVGLGRFYLWGLPDSKGKEFGIEHPIFLIAPIDTEFGIWQILAHQEVRLSESKVQEVNASAKASILAILLEVDFGEERRHAEVTFRLLEREFLVMRYLMIAMTHCHYMYSVKFQRRSFCQGSVILMP